MKKCLNYKNKRNLLILGIILLMLVNSIMISTIYGIYCEDKTEYLELYDSYLSVRENLEFQHRYIETLQDKEIEHEDDLYNAFKSYYENRTDNTIFKYVFEERFPSVEEYEKDRKQAFIVIYALIELYPELKYDEEIGLHLSEIDVNLDKIRTAVEEYNGDLISYNSIVGKINATNYINTWKQEPKITETFREIEFIES